MKISLETEIKADHRLLYGYYLENGRMQIKKLNEAKGYKKLQNHHNAMWAVVHSTR